MKRWVIAPIILFSVAYYAYIPLPEDAIEPYKQHIPALTLKIVDDVGRLAELFGFSRLNATRAVTDMSLMAGKYLHPKIEGIQAEEGTFDGIGVRIFKPTTPSKELRPGVVYIHGGGWSLLSVDGYDRFTRALAKKTQAIVISVDYRLAPEHVFPAAFDDCVKATKYFMKNAAVFGVDSSKIGVAGDSAGGNLAMAVSLYFGKENITPKLNFQGLIYPILQAMDYNLSSYREFDLSMRNTYTPVTKTTMIHYYNLYGFGGDQYVEYFKENTHTTRETKKKYRKLVDPSQLTWKYQMIPDDDNSKENIEIANKVANVILNPYFAPLMATDEELKLLPKTYLITAEYDGLRDEGMILGHRLRRINHPLNYKHWDGVEHGFMIYSFYDSYKAGLEHLSSYIKEVSV
ncbi:neutral cholesterol ester hydrolase 1-like [Mytilus edulis]|uniref:neutral cholesterol ester hydrolase 1-like n=1 Tax=Mytilus edulis TaxID=6550 RepID=UPI0039F01072